MASSLLQIKKLCSIEINTDGVAIACFSNSPNPEITECSFYPCQNNAQLKQYLMEFVLQKNLKKASCSWVLHPDQYHLTLVNTPNVPQVEYKNAVRWQIKDIINYPLEDASIEVFYPDELEKRPKKIYVIAAQNRFLQNIINIIQECYLQPVAIDIREFSIRNLIAPLSIENEPVGFLDIATESSLLVIVQQQCIRFVRRMPFSLKKLKTGSYDDLANELQRSFNYCSTELKQKIPTKFFIPPSMDIDTNTVQNIAKHLNKEVTVLNLQQLLHFTTPINLETETHCWAAIGGALRKQSEDANGTKH